jgi:hypothetical protein
VDALPLGLTLTGSAFVEAFLPKAIPGLDVAPLEEYTGRLVADGFDSRALIKNVALEDLEFCRNKAHKRAILKLASTL